MVKCAELPEDKVAAKSLLQQYLDEDLTAICLVLGSDAITDTCWTNVKRQATDENARGIRVRDVTVLSPKQAAEWRPQPDLIATFLTPEDPRRVSCRLAPPDATSGPRLYSAFVDALAGRISE